ncbi:MAG: hypothetical protein GY853_13180 [PVC group bacterium]|nr:hypothetical protein [PVC group bacterium]
MKKDELNIYYKASWGDFVNTVLDLALERVLRKFGYYRFGSGISKDGTRNLEFYRKA